MTNSENIVRSKRCHDLAEKDSTRLAHGKVAEMVVKVAANRRDN